MNVLERLTSDQFSVDVGSVTSVAGLRRYLLHSSFVKDLKAAIVSAEITESQIRRFSNLLLKDFVPGVLFPHELAIAAIAVAIESRRTSFTEEYLLDLARLTIAEMPWSAAIARDCCTQRNARPRVKQPRQREFQRDGELRKKIVLWKEVFSRRVVKKWLSTNVGVPFAYHA